MLLYIILYVFPSLGVSMLLAYLSLGSSLGKKESIQEKVLARKEEQRPAEPVFMDSLDEPVR